MPTATIEVDEETGEIVSDTVLANALRGTIYDGQPQAALPGFEGFAVSMIEVAFTGTVSLNPNDPEEAALFASLTMGAEVDLQVRGYVLKVQHSTKNPDTGQVTRRATVTIDEV